MTTYRAAVKYAVDATYEEKRRALREGLAEVTTELVAEFGYDMDDIDAALEDARNAAEDELDALKREKEKK